MAYATTALVFSRSGKVGKAWQVEGAVPGVADAEKALDTTADEINGYLSGRGYTTPLDSEGEAAKALAGLNADMAILILLPGTYVRDRDAVANLRDEVKSRVDAGQLSLELGTHSAIAILEQTASAAGTGSSASSLWTAPGGMTLRDRLANQPRTRRGDIL